MNRSHRASLGLAVFLFTVGGVCADVARAQNAPLASIPLSMKTSTSMSAADIAAMTEFVQREVTDKGGVSNVDNRKLLIDGVMTPSTTPADPAFLLNYSSALDGALTNILNTNPKDLHLRVCIGVVAARVAENAQDSALLNTAMLLLKDKSEAVQVWGMKTARGIIPFVLNSQALQELVVKQAKAANSGLVVEDAYAALAPDTAPQAVQVAMVPKVIELLQHRVDDFANDINDQPMAESKPVFFLLQLPMWSTPAGKKGSLTPAERAQTAQLVTNLLWLATQHLNDPNVSPDQQTQLRILIRNISGAIQALSGVMFNNPALSGAARTVNQEPNVAMDSMFSNVGGLLSQIYSEPAFGAGLKVPPTLDKDHGGQAPPPQERPFNDRLDHQLDKAMGRFTVIPLALLALLAMTMFWSGGASERKADFTFVNRGDINTLDPNRMSWLQDIRLGYSLFEGVYTLDPKTLQAVPGCADRIELNDARTVYTIHIRADAKWCNKQPVRSDDFVYAWRRMLEKPGDYTYLFFYIKGAKEYSDAFAAAIDRDATTRPAIPDFNTVGVQNPDAATLIVTLNHPVTFFPDLLSFAPFFPLYEPSIDQMDDNTKQPINDPIAHRPMERTDWTRPPNLVGNGPYQLTDWDFKRRLRIVATPTYWDRANVKSQVIDVLSAEDPLAAFLMYDTGRIDWQAEVLGNIAAEVKAKGRSDLHLFPGFGTYFYTINCNQKLPNGSPNPFHDIRVRQAFSMAIDKTGIVNQITRLGEKTADTYIPPGIFKGYVSPAGLPYDIAGARKLLADAGYPNGQGFPKFEILYNTEGQHPAIAEYVRKQWIDNLGISPDMAGVEIKTFRNRLHDKDYVVARASWIGDYNDPSTFTDKYLSESDNNDSAWKNPKYDELCKKAEWEADPAARLKILAEAEAILNQEAPIIPMYYYTSAYLYHDNVTGIPSDPRNMVMLKAVEVVHKDGH